MARKKNVTGRPKSITKTVVSKLTEAFKVDATVQEACCYAGISTVTYYRELKANDDFRHTMEQSQHYAFIVAKKTLMKAVEKGDGTLALKWLERRQRDRYKAEKQHDEKPITIIRYEDIQESKERLSQGMRPKTPQEAIEMAEKLDLGPEWNMPEVAKQAAVGA